jgi:hypothetical protein
LRPSNNPDESHALVWDLIDVFRRNPNADSQNSLVFGYKETPCSQCREQVISLLIKQNTLLESMFEECRFDSNQDIQKLVENHLQEP